MPYDYKTDGATVDYIPKWEQQRSRYELGEETEPVTVTLKLVTMQDSEAWSRRAFALRRPAGQAGDDESNEDEQNLELSKQQIIGGIGGIKNLYFNGQEITNGSELWGTPYKDLIMEVARAIANWSVLTAGDVRNLRLVSAGSTGGTTSTADNA